MISEPVDYDLTAEQTLAHQMDGELPEGFIQAFDSHWLRFREAVSALPKHWQGRLDGPVNQVIIRSLDSIRVVAKVTLPQLRKDVRAIVVASHGYSEVPDAFGDDPEPWTGLPVAVVRVRVRGFPPSTMDVPDLRSQWIMHNPPLSIDVASAWVVQGAIADIVRAALTARNQFGSNVPIMLHGESLGGGLATIAAAQLSHINQPPERMILEHPSLGDWRWRTLKYCNGAGAEINRLLDALRAEQRESLLGGVLLFDAALHARMIRCPVLAKLAERDDVVPAPTAAAIVNELPGDHVWRFITRFGHFDGGIAHARRHLAFERLRRNFFDPDRSPNDTLQPLTSVLNSPHTTAKIL